MARAPACGFIVLLLAGCASAPHRVDLLVEDVTVHPGTGEAPFRARVAVADGRFAAVDRDGRRRLRATTVIDGTALHLAPGLWDMHVHLANEGDGNLDAAAFPAHGVTSVRDLGGQPAQLAAARTAIAAGTLAGPAIHAAGRTLNGAAHAPFQRVVASREDAARAVDEQIDAGAAVIKVHRALDPALLPAVVAQAHARGRRVTGHIPLGMDPLAACGSGMDGVEHLGSFLEARVSVTPGASAVQALAWLESDAAAPLVACLARRRVEVTPTLVLYEAVAQARAKDGAMPAGFADFLAGLQRVAARLHAAGVPLLAGSDAAAGELALAPGESLLRELERLQAAGIAPREVLAIATQRAARSLGLDAVTGAIAPGLAADFLLLEADPDIDVRHLRQRRAVYRGGRRVATAD